MSRLDHGLEPAVPVRRIKVISGAIGRRRWSGDDRARIVEVTLAPGAAVSVVARRHGLTPQQLFIWRRQARKSAETLPAFVPGVIVPEPTAAAPFANPQRKRAPRAVWLRGAARRGGDRDRRRRRKGDNQNGASAATFAAVIRALKSGA